VSPLPFREIWCVDFEYEAASGAHPVPLCMCGHEIVSGREIRLWRGELLALKRPPLISTVTASWSLMRLLPKHRAS
jgi:hypothetical protein